MTSCKSRDAMTNPELKEFHVTGFLGKATDLVATIFVLVHPLHTLGYLRWGDGAWLYVLVGAWLDVLVGAWLYVLGGAWLDKAVRMIHMNN